MIALTRAFTAARTSRQASLALNMSADNSSSESPPTLRWKQGEIDGTIPLTKASGVRAALATLAPSSATT